MKMETKPYKRISVHELHESSNVFQSAATGETDIEHGNTTQYDIVNHFSNFLCL